MKGLADVTRKKYHSKKKGCLVKTTCYIIFSRQLIIRGHKLVCFQFSICYLISAPQRSFPLFAVSGNRILSCFFGQLKFLLFYAVFPPWLSSCRALHLAQSFSHACVVIYFLETAPCFLILILCVRDWFSCC